MKGKTVSRQDAKTQRNAKNDVGEIEMFGHKWIRIQ